VSEEKGNREERIGDSFEIQLTEKKGTETSTYKKKEKGILRLSGGGGGNIIGGSWVILQEGLSRGKRGKSTQSKKITEERESRTGDAGVKLWVGRFGLGRRKVGGGPEGPPRQNSPKKREEGKKKIKRNLSRSPNSPCLKRGGKISKI